ncbi:MAG: hypothetical protein BGO56_00755 [Sphingobacteriales bacterium 48-107]|nr:MAG: hypothetical protein BGO56_00755 [Sphingobacteriales bacterium 48-107]
MLHHIYILQSLRDSKYYIGYTTDVIGDVAPPLAGHLHGVQGVASSIPRYYLPALLFSFFIALFNFAFPENGM